MTNNKADHIISCFSCHEFILKINFTNFFCIFKFNFFVYLNFKSLIFKLLRRIYFHDNASVNIFLLSYLYLMIYKNKLINSTHLICLWFNLPKLFECRSMVMDSSKSSILSISLFNLKRYIFMFLSSCCVITEFCSALFRKRVCAKMKDKCHIKFMKT